MSRCMLLSLTVIVLSGCRGGDNADPSQNSGNSTTPETEDSRTAAAGHESPQAVFAAWQEASEAGDLPAMLRCLSPQSRETVAASTVMSLSAVAAAQPENDEEVKKLLGKYGIALDGDRDGIPIEPVEDKIAFIADLTAWMDANGAEEILGSSYRPRGIPGTLGEVTIEGDSAQAVATLDKYRTEDVRFVRLGGNWFVQLPVIPGLTPGTTMDAELLADSIGKTLDVSEWNKLFPPPVEAVTIKQFHSSWMVTLDVKAQPAGQLLEKLADELGLEFDAGSVSEETLQKPVTFQVSDGSRLAAIEMICRQVELTPVYTPTTVRFEPGKRPDPAILAGPFLFAVTELTTSPATGTGQMQIQVFAPHLPPIVLRQLEDSFEAPVSVDAVIDENNNNLLRSFESFENGASFETDATAFSYLLSVKLKNLLQRVEAIHRLTGMLSFSLPTRVEALKFDELKAGAEQASDGVTIKLSDVDGGSFTFDCDGVDGDNLQILAFDSKGRRVGATGFSGYSGAASGTITQQYSDRMPVRFEIRAVTRRESLDYEFLISEIPVPNYREMPEQLAKLEFEGESPLTLKFKSVGGNPQFPEIEFLATNHSNKDAESTALQLTCLDADGKVSEEFVTFYEEVIPGGNELNIKVSVFDLPQGTKTVKAIVTGIEFTDATEWEVKEE